MMNKTIAVNQTARVGGNNMETDKILIHYVQFAADMFCNFSGHTNIVTEMVVNDTVHVSFYNSPSWHSFDCDVHFNTTQTVEGQIMKAFEGRMLV